jgi:hypothetical protein
MRYITNSGGPGTWVVYLWARYVPASKLPSPHSGVVGVSRQRRSQVGPLPRRGFCGPNNVRPPRMFCVPGCLRLAPYGRHQGIHYFWTPPLLPFCPGFPRCKAWVRGNRPCPLPRSSCVNPRTEAAPSARPACGMAPEG